MSIKKPKSKLFKIIDPESESKEDLGFGEKFIDNYSRLLNEDGTFNIIRTGDTEKNIFKKLITLGWAKLFIYFIILYIIINFGFALLYYLGGLEGIANINSGNLFYEIEQLFYFSVQTFTTVGYGSLSPISTFANILATFNAFIGLMFFALVTGLFFSKFTTPIDHIKFSKNIIIAPFKNKKALMLRMANTIDNHIMNLSARVTMSWITEENNMPIRRFAILPLEIDAINLFPLNWTLVHAIDEQSPLYAKTKQDLMELKAEFIVMVSGYDRTYGKKIFSNRSYVCKDLISGAIFDTMYESKNRETLLHLENIDNIREHIFDSEE
jgi:inward rectifier potassium channel